MLGASVGRLFLVGLYVCRQRRYCLCAVSSVCYVRVCEAVFYNTKDGLDQDKQRQGTLTAFCQGVSSARSVPVAISEKMKSPIMTRNQQTDHNQRVIQVLFNLVQQHQRYSPRAYRVIVALFNAQGLLTSRDNSWASKSLLMMVQRKGISGLHGLFD